MLSEGGPGDDWDEDDGNFPCDECCDYIEAMMRKSWVDLNAALVMATASQIDAIARATQPDDEIAQIKISSLRSVECIAIAVLWKLVRPQELDAALDIMRGHIRTGLDQLQEQRKQDHAKRQRKAAPGNGGGNDWPQ